MTQPEHPAGRYSPQGLLSMLRGAGPFAESVAQAEQFWAGLRAQEEELAAETAALHRAIDSWPPEVRDGLQARLAEIQRDAEDIARSLPQPTTEHTEN